MAKARETAGGAPPDGTTQMVPAPHRSGATAVVLRPAMAKLAQDIDDTAASYALAIHEATGDAGRAFLVADGIAAMRKAISSEAMVPIMQLMNSPLGFLTDRPNKNNAAPYAEAVVKDCVIHALLQGFRLVNNEFNIVAGKCMGVLNGWQRKFREADGVTDINVVRGVPKPFNGNWLVRIGISWRSRGTPDMLRDHKGDPGREYVVSGSGNDQLIGKALRRAYRDAFEKATGTTTPGEADDVSEATSDASPNALPSAPPSRTEAVRQQLGAAHRQPTRQELVARADELLSALEYSEREAGELCAELGCSTLAELDAAGIEAVIADLEKQLERRRAEQA